MIPIITPSSIVLYLVLGSILLLHPENQTAATKGIDAKDNKGSVKGISIITDELTDELSNEPENEDDLLTFDKNTPHSTLSTLTSLTLLSTAASASSGSSFSMSPSNSSNLSISPSESPPLPTRGVSQTSTRDGDEDRGNCVDSHGSSSIKGLNSGLLGSSSPRLFQVSSIWKEVEEACKEKEEQKDKQNDETLSQTRNIIKEPEPTEEVENKESTEEEEVENLLRNGEKLLRDGLLLTEGLTGVPGRQVDLVQKQQATYEQQHQQQHFDSKMIDEFFSLVVPTISTEDEMEVPSS